MDFIRVTREPSRFNVEIITARLKQDFRGITVFLAVRHLLPFPGHHFNLGFTPVNSPATCTAARAGRLSLNYEAWIPLTIVQSLIFARYVQVSLQWQWISRVRILRGPETIDEDTFRFSGVSVDWI